MHKDVELAVKLVLDQISNALARDERIEIRGFGSFALHPRTARVGRNPKTGEPVQIPPKRVPHYKPGKEMRERVHAVAAEEASTAQAAMGGAVGVHQTAVPKCTSRRPTARSEE